MQLIKMIQGLMVGVHVCCVFGVELLLCRTMITQGLMFMCDVCSGRTLVVSEQYPRTLGWCACALLCIVCLLYLTKMIQGLMAVVCVCCYALCVRGRALVVCS